MKPDICYKSGWIFTNTGDTMISWGAEDIGQVHHADGGQV